MKSLGSGATKLLGKLAINPSYRQAHLARELKVTRSAVNQLWKKLEQENNLRILSNLDYGAIGFQSIYGWASTEMNSQGLSSFERWIRNHSNSIYVLKSLMSSKMDNRLFFEVKAPVGKAFGQFIDTLERYRKKPYNLDITYDYSSAIAHHLNFGYYDGLSWNFESDFRFEASIDAARDYADILPIIHAKRQSSPKNTNLEEKVIAAVLESNYYCTSSDIILAFKRMGLRCPSERTLRRRLSELRASIAQPYLSIDRIGLTQKVIITLEESEESSIYKLLRSQSASFPKVRVVSGTNSIGLILDIPERTDWLHISNIISNIAGTHSRTCTFIARQVQERNWLENIVHNMQKQQV